MSRFDGSHRLDWRIEPFPAHDPTRLLSVDALEAIARNIGLHVIATWAVDGGSCAHFTVTGEIPGIVVEDLH